MENNQKKTTLGKAKKTATADHNKNMPSFLHFSFFVSSEATKLPRKQKKPMTKTVIGR